MRDWTLNGDFVGLSPTGVARYAREVTLALDQCVADGHPLTRDVSLTLVAPREPADMALSRIAVRVVPEYRRPRLPQVWVQCQLPWHVRGGLVSFCNLAPVAVSRHIACIHDLHTWIMPESYGRGFRLAHRLILPLVGRRARVVTTVSNLSREHLAQYGVADPAKVVVTYNGADHASRWSAARSRLEVPTGRPFAVCLGRKQRYKNGELIWAIAPGLADLGLDILMAGDIDAEGLKSFGPDVPTNVHVLGRISDDDLAAILSRAVAFLFPSRIEGFGIPAVEAMMLGCPVVASTSPCLPEICGDAALYGGPDDPAAWVAAVARLAGNPAERQAMVERGRQQAARYTWRGIAEQYLALMADVDGVTAR